MAGPWGVLGGIAATLLTKKGVEEIGEGLDDGEEEE